MDWDPDETTLEMIEARNSRLLKAGKILVVLLIIGLLVF